MKHPRLVGSAVTALVTILLLGPVLHLGDASADVPFRYREDGLYFGMTVKTVIEQGWYDHNDRVGAPYGLDLNDYPALGGNNLDYIVIKVLGVFSHDYAVVENAYYLLTFALVAVVAFLVLSWVGLSAVIAGAMAILYAFAPYHLYRGENHLMLSAYYAVPLGCWLGLRVMHGERFGFGRQLAGVTLACLVIGSSSGSAYYAAFSAVLVVLAALFAFLWQRDRRALLSGLGVAALIVAALAVNLVPTLVYRAQHGPNPEAATRSAPESENFGLKVAQMVLPVEGHRIGALARLRAHYAQFPPRTEADASTLGTVATVGFLWLVVVAVGALGRPPTRGRQRERELSAATLGLVAIATVGGGATLIALLLTTQIRSWNRVSVFVAFFALAAAGLLVDRLRPHLGESERRVMVAVAVVLVLVGLADQVTPALLPPYGQIRAEYRVDHRFVTALEGRLPRGAAIFQLPYVAFPEPPPVNGMETDYDQLRGFLHSRHLRWSGGAMKDRPGDWPAAHAAKPLETVLPAVAVSGFAGVWVDRVAFGLAADAVQQRVQAITGAQPIVSDDARVAFMDLRALARSVRQRLGAERVKTLRDATLHPVRVLYSGGFSPIDNDLTETWRWAGRVARVELVNPAPRAQDAVVTVPVDTPTQGDFEVVATGPGGAAVHQSISPQRSSLEIRVVLPPGKSSLSLTTNAPLRPVAPSQVRSPARIRVFSVDVTTEAMREALAAG